MSNAHLRQDLLVFWKDYWGLNCWTCHDQSHFTFSCPYLEWKQRVYFSNNDYLHQDESHPLVGLFLKDLREESSLFWSDRQSFCIHTRHQCTAYWSYHDNGPWWSLMNCHRIFVLQVEFKFNLLLDELDLHLLIYKKSVWTSFYATELTCHYNHFPTWSQNQELIDRSQSCLYLKSFVSIDFDPINTQNLDMIRMRNLN